MNEIQIKLLDILKWFDDFCDKNELTYYVTGGTALGAVRHQGFIPWDDDIDVGMPRPDYEKFCKLMKDAKGKYVLETPQDENEDFLYPMAKIYDTETTAIEALKVPCKRGLYIDIFPNDGLGIDIKKAKARYNKFYFKNMFLTARTAIKRKERKGWKNLAIRFANLIPEKIINTKKYAKDFDKMAAQKDFETSMFIAEYACGFGAKHDIFNKNIIFPTKEYEFEGLKVKGPNKAEEYLSQTYGKWWELPPIDKRTSGHDFLEVDLNKAFLKE